MLFCFEQLDEYCPGQEYSGALSIEWALTCSLANEIEA